LKEKTSVPAINLNKMRLLCEGKTYLKVHMQKIL
jgi:hypothetical protein